LIRLHPLCQESDNGFEADLGYVPEGLDESTDGIVAGALMLAVKPLPGPLRTKLLAMSKRHWFGSFLVLHGMVFAGEAESLLAGVACDPRLAAALWRENQDLAEPLVPVAMAKNDLWSATLALHQPLASERLGRVNIFGETDPLAAVTALVLQPTAPQKTLWMQRLKQGHPRLAYLAVRWARLTWPEPGWENLRDELRANAVSDRGLAWYGWYRDVQPELIDEAIRETDVATLWQAELVDHAHNSGQELRRRMGQRLQSDDKDKEALLTLRWLDRRGRPR
jgi:hypothetical protein